MKNVFFGLGLNYAQGTRPRIALSDDLVVEVHQRSSDKRLYYCTGRLDQMDIGWNGGSGIEYAEGTEADVAMRGNNLVMVHRAPDGKGLMYLAGTWDGNQMDVGEERKYADGESPCVATKGDAVVAIHQSRDSFGLILNLGKVNDPTIVNWQGNDALWEGYLPAVAVNAANQVVVTYAGTGTPGMYYRVGALSETRSRGGPNELKIAWGAPILFATTDSMGSMSSVALSDDGHVIVVYDSPEGELWQRFGKIREGAIKWAGDAVHFDDGIRPGVACSGGMAIQTHESETFNTLWASTSRITNRARWMNDNLRTLGKLTLRELTTGASHDAGMYKHGVLATLGKTQNLDLYGQLSNGIRYFDLRPKWSDETLYVHHGGVSGAPLSEIVDDVARFLEDGKRELIVLKFSHYSGFTDGAYATLVFMLQEKLGQWLYRRPVPADGHLWDIKLGEVPLEQYLADSGTVLVVCDDGYPVDITATGIWAYRDYDSATANQGNLIVYDKYSNKLIYDKMKNDQLEKFGAYDGLCAPPHHEVTCDQFLLSWTLTPPTGVWQVSKEANRHLGEVMAQTPRHNDKGFVINYLYVDYEEYSRATDVAMFMNGIT